MTTQWLKISSLSSKRNAFTEANRMIDEYIHFCNHERIQIKQERRRLRAATPLES